VDIDLDFAENLTKEETAAKRERISELLGLYMIGEGYTLKGKSKHARALDSFVYSYANAGGNPDNIKAEINYGLRSHALPSIETAARTDGTFPDFIVRTLAPVEIFASKIVALERFWKYARSEMLNGAHADAFAEFKPGTSMRVSSPARYEVMYVFL
jgi:hypothetical protein